MDALHQNIMRLLEQRGSLRQEVEMQRLETVDLKERFDELCDELEELKSHNRQLLMARALIANGADMGIAKEWMTQMVKRMDQSITLLELQHSIDTIQPH